ncbi:ATP-binding protein [soil metagenome]
MMMQPNEDDMLRAVALKNAQSIFAARQRAENDLDLAKEALELKSAQLEQSLAMMRATLESTTNGILVTDDCGQVTSYNEQYVRMWRLTPEMMALRRHHDLLEVVARQFSDGAGFIARVEEIYAASPPESIDLLELADGRVIERFSKVQQIGGKNAGRVWSFSDISEQRRTEEALRDEGRILELLNETGTRIASKLELQTLVQAITDAATKLSKAAFGAFFYMKSDKPEDGLMLYTLSGAPREAFEKFGQPQATALFGPTFQGAAPIRCDDVRLDPRYGKSAPHHGMPQGHLPVRSYLAVPVIAHSGKVLGSLFFGHPDPGVFTKRSERLIVGIAAQAAIAIDNARLYEAAQAAAREREQLLENERSARADAEKSSQMKDEFLATLSHELRTPLNSILGWSEILLLGRRSDSDIQKGLETIARNASVQAQLIEDLLDMNRITSGKMRLDVQQVDPVAIIESAMETVRPAADAKGIRLRKMLDPDAGPLSGDPSRLQQVIWNLLSNAIKFTPRGGKVQILLERENSHVALRVADTGTGIAPEFLPHFFDRFRQADGSTTRRYGGLGLGLSIVKALVELHGGTVAVSSAGEGLGTTFSVSLPISAVQLESEQGFGLHLKRTQRKDEGQDLSGVTVLVVDDEVDARDLLARVLGDRNARVITSSCAAEALGMVESERPDVLLSDIGMPHKDGFELLREVRSLGQEKGGMLPAIALTAFARAEDRARALSAGFMVHISKPVNATELIATVASAVGRS